MFNKPCIDCGRPVRTSRCPSCTEKRLQASPQPTKEKTSVRGYGADWQRIRRLVLDRDGWVCYKCNKKLVGSDATVDHIVPLSVDSSLRLVSSNLAACCRSCNSKKSNTH